MEPLGRVLALKSLIARTPARDPDNKISAQMIELKVFLQGSGPMPTEPGAPVVVPSSGSATLTRPPNRAERRRLRRASG